MRWLEVEVSGFTRYSYTTPTHFSLSRSRPFLPPSMSVCLSGVCLSVCLHAKFVEANRAQAQDSGLLGGGG